MPGKKMRKALPNNMQGTKEPDEGNARHGKYKAGLALPLSPLPKQGTRYAGFGRPCGAAAAACGVRPERGEGRTWKVEFPQLDMTR